MGYLNEKGQWESDSTAMLGRVVLPTVIVGILLVCFLIWQILL